MFMGGEDGMVKAWRLDGGEEEDVRESGPERLKRRRESGVGKRFRPY